MAKVDWDRRRKNIRILMALAGTNPTRLAAQVELSPNTLSKFTNGSTQTLSEKSLAKVVEALGLSSASDLDTDNPINDPKVVLRRLIDELPEDALPGLARELEVRFSDHLKK
ncbi:helix-turn-helix transcriptional regulator [Phaeobacter inhibens]|uniref:helix-turn-helix domain-containing protein n=1 Tax=Phaeobacter inhibens TaxID=221822 RepID=UPI0021A6D8D5|nr:helix-turn-helix transcriptional regulator [Phaeobacter inhibens]UWR67053.1 helix-turn-helix transcriptional regulator [Phaeobacter inhibens]